jgi:peptidyl-prolyl cis-trans isomerase C
MPARGKEAHLSGSADRGARAAAAGLALAWVWIAGCGGGGSGKTPGEEPLKVVARVNDTEVSERMVEDAIGLFLAQRPAGAPEPTPGQRTALRRNVLETLINQELMLQKAQAQGIEAPAEEIDRRVQALGQRYGSADEMRQALERAGLSEAKVRALLERSLRIELFLERHVVSLVSVADAQVEEYFKTHPEEMRRPEAVRASHILVLAEEGKASAEERQGARARAQEILGRLRAGGDFAALARQYSQDGSAERGGDLGYFARGRMTPTFERAAFSLQVGKLSDVVETPFGYHLIKVTDRQPPHTFTLAEIREPLRQRLADQEKERRSKELLESLRGEARIEIF